MKYKNNILRPLIFKVAFISCVRERLRLSVSVCMSTLRNALRIRKPNIMLTIIHFNSLTRQGNMSVCVWVCIIIIVSSRLYFSIQHHSNIYYTYTPDCCCFVFRETFFVREFDVLWRNIWTKIRFKNVKRHKCRKRNFEEALTGHLKV